MRVRLLTAILFLNFHNTLSAEDAVANFRFSDKDCKNIAKEFSEDAFEETNYDMKKNTKLYTKETKEYFNKTQLDISSGFNNICTIKKSNVSFADIYKEQLSCSNKCKENIKMVKGAFLKIVEDINKTKERAQAACLLICDQGQQKLDAIKIGIAYGIKNKNSPDCSGAVSDKGRGIEAKAIEANLNTSKAIHKATGK